jgi:hypothetical protein
MDRVATFGVWLALLAGMSPVLWAVIEWAGRQWPKLPKKYVTLGLGVLGGLVMLAAGWLPSPEGGAAWAGWLLAALGGLGSAVIASKGINDRIANPLKKALGKKT